VVGYRNEDGSANLCGYQLPADRAAAACAHLDALAKKIKHAGDGRPIDSVRADLYLAMLDGSYTGWSEHDIIAHILTTSPGAGLDQPDHERRRNGSSAATSPEHNGQVDDAAGMGDDRAVDRADDHGTPTARRAGVEIRVELTTLLGLDDHPGELPGSGPVPADVARRLVRDQTAAEWRYALTDDDGRLRYEGITRRRPAGYPPRSASPCRGGIVELQVRVSALRQLAARPVRLDGWANVIADMIRQADQHERTECTDRREQADRRGHIGQYNRAEQCEQLDQHAPAGQYERAGDGRDGDGRDGERHGGGRRDRPAAQDRKPDDERGPRSPGRPLRRRTEIRDRTCTHPRCRAPANGTDGDHIQDWANGGATHETNIGSACRHDHRLKHEGGWQVAQPAAGRLVWISRLGVHYRVPPPLIIQPLPSPLPRVQAPPYETQAQRDAPIWREPVDKPTEPGRSPPPDLHEPIPF
jgi:HNH endonuclease